MVGDNMTNEELEFRDIAEAKHICKGYMNIIQIKEKQIEDLNVRIHKLEYLLEAIEENFKCLSIGIQIVMNREERNE